MLDCLSEPLTGYPDVDNGPLTAEVLAAHLKGEVRIGLYPEALLGIKVPAWYDEAVTFLADLRDLARRDGQCRAVRGRFTAYRPSQFRLCRPRPGDRLAPGVEREQ